MKAYICVWYMHVTLSVCEHDILPRVTLRDMTHSVCITLIKYMIPVVFGQLSVGVSGGQIVESL